MLYGKPEIKVEQPNGNLHVLCINKIFTIRVCKFYSSEWKRAMESAFWGHESGWQHETEQSVNMPAPMGVVQWTKRLSQRVLERRKFLYQNTVRPILYSETYGKAKAQSANNRGQMKKWKITSIEN